jgi:hypothetical protein
VLAPVVAPNAVAAFVQQAMMVRAQQYQVVDACFTSIDPMIHVMRLDEPRALTARERAVPIA